MGVFSLFFLGSLTLETRVMYVDVYLCAHSCDGRHTSATDHGTGRGHLRGFLTLQLVFRQSLLFTTACTGRLGLCTPCVFLFPPPVLLSEHWHTAPSGFYMGSGASNTAPAPPHPRVCPVSAFPTESSLQPHSRTFVD